MADSILAKNIGSFFENATKNITTSLESSNVPPSISRLINNYNSSTNNPNLIFTSKQILDGLNSTNETDKLTVLKYLVKLMSTNFNSTSTTNELTQFFPMIINNINSKNLKIKRYVYMILLRFNHLKQDVSLLSINAIQKSLSDKNYINRSLSIRCLSGIKIPAILPILVLSLKKSVKDSSPLVRASSCVAIIKCFKLDKDYNGSTVDAESLNDESSIVHQLYQLLDTLLSDNDPKVLSLAIGCYHEIFISCSDLLHNKINHILSKLELLDDYAQSLFIDIFTDYAKLYVPSCLNTANSISNNTTIIAPELEVLLLKLKLLVYSANPNVIISLTRCLVSTFPPTIVQEFQLNHILVRFLNDSNKTVSYLFLNEIYYLISSGNGTSIQFTESQITLFQILSKDNYPTGSLKILIFLKLINSSNFEIHFDHIKFLIEKSNISSSLKCLVIKNLNSLNVTDTQFNQLIKFFLNKLNELGDSNDTSLINEYILSLRQLVQDDLKTHIEILIKLTGQLVNKSGSLTSVAKSSIIWLLGEFAIDHNNNKDDEDIIVGQTQKCNVLFNYLPDLFRILLINFKNEQDQVKLEILTSLSKLLASTFYMVKKLGGDHGMVELHGNKLWKLFNYTLQLCKYDKCLDIKDRSRLIGTILPNVVYQVDTTGGAHQQLNIDTLLSYNEQLCYNKLNEIEVSILIFQNKKLKPVGGSKNIEIDDSIDKFNRVTDDQLDSKYSDYYNEFRGLGFQLRDYNKYSNSISSSSAQQHNFGIGGGRFSSPPITGGAFGGRDTTPTSSSSIKNANVKKYRLQTLDDFLNDGGKYTPDDEEEEDSEDEGEEDSGESEEEEEDEVEEEEEEEEEESDEGKNLLQR